MGSRGSSWEKPGASSEDEASPRAGSLRVTGTWYPHTFPWEQPMLQVMAVPEILGLQGGSCRWRFQKGFSKKRLAKGVLGKGSCQKGLLNRVFQEDFAKNILRRGWVPFPGIKVPRQWAVMQGEHPPMQIAGIKTASSQTDDTSSLLKHFPAWGLAASPVIPTRYAPCGKGAPRGAPAAAHTQHPTPKQGEGGAMEDVGDKS